MPRDVSSSSPVPLRPGAHGTVGLTRSCAPSLFADVANGIPALPQALQHGWVMVAPGYVGMGTEGHTPYLIGTGEAYSALDAARATGQMSLRCRSRIFITHHIHTDQHGVGSPG